MRDPAIHHCLQAEMLWYVRDNGPTREQMLEWYGPSEAGCFYALLKAGVLEEQEDIVRLSSEHVLDGGRYFKWETEPNGCFLLYDLENDEGRHYYAKQRAGDGKAE